MKISRTKRGNRNEAKRHGNEEEETKRRVIMWMKHAGDYLETKYMLEGSPCVCGLWNSILTPAWQTRPKAQ